LNELQLVGYTADLQHLVLSDAAGASRFRVPVDDDFLATVEEVVGLARPESSFLQPATEPPSTVPEPAAPLEPEGLAPGEGALAASGLLAQRAVVASDAEAEQQRGSKLSPREIQALLRAGKTPAAVAKLAGTDEALILRWLPPIEAERDQVLQGVWRQRVSKARLGPSHDLLGEAVRRNLSAKSVQPEEEARWTVARRDGDDVWSVELRYRSRGRAQRALWRYDPETDHLDPRNDLATEIAWTRPRRGKGAGTTVPEPQPTSGEEAGAPEPREAEGQQRTSKKASAKKTAAKKAAAKKTAAKKASAKKASAKKTAAKKTAAKKAAAKKTAAKKTAAKKASAKKAPAKAASATKVVAKKALIRRPRAGEPGGSRPAGPRPAPSTPPSPSSPPPPAGGS
jgi:hypothetical protein